MDDIGSWPGPVYQELEERRLDQNTVKEAEARKREIADTQRKITDQKARQGLLADSTANSQRTMNQLLEFQRSSLEKNVTPSSDERRALAESQQRFLANQTQYQILNEEIVRLNEQVRGLNETQGGIQTKLASMRQKIRRLEPTRSRCA